MASKPDRAGGPARASPDWSASSQPTRSAHINTTRYYECTAAPANGVWRSPYNTVVSFLKDTPLKFRKNAELKESKVTVTRPPIKFTLQHNFTRQFQLRSYRDKNHGQRFTILLKFYSQARKYKASLHVQTRHILLSFERFIQLLIQLIMYV